MHVSLLNTTEETCNTSVRGTTTTRLKLLLVLQLLLQAIGGGHGIHFLFLQNPLYRFEDNDIASKF